ncbi:MAG: hypothetical protein QG658_575 [Patescibacteria group bacterium]|nr:hypothetical protein [Patescibacteria group bacterium]
MKSALFAISAVARKGYGFFTKKPGISRVFVVLNADVTFQLF